MMAPITRQSRLRRTAQIKSDHQKRHSLHHKFLRPGLFQDQIPEDRIRRTKDQATDAFEPLTGQTVSDHEFFELSAELRKMAYASACREAAPLFLESLEPAPWMLASKQILHDSTPIFLGSNVFRTLICSNTDYDDMRLAVRQQTRHPSTHISSRTLEWLAGALCIDAPLIRDIGFAFAVDKKDRDCFFRLSYRDNKPILSHGRCIMCDKEGFGPHIEPYDMRHPALSPNVFISHQSLASNLGSYHHLKRLHDEDLQQWDTILKSFNLSHLGLSLQDIENIARTLRNHYVTPYVASSVAQVNLTLGLPPPATLLEFTARICLKAYVHVAQIKQTFEHRDRLQAASSLQL